MKTLNENQYHLIKPDLPVQRGNVKIWSLDLINAVLYTAENGCKWRSLPEKFGHRHTIYPRAKRWAERGVLERLCIGMQKEKLIKISVTCLGLDSTSIKVHPDALTTYPKPEYGKMKTHYLDLVVAGTKDSIIDSSDVFIRKAKETGAPITYMRISDMDHYVRKKEDVIKDSFAWLKKQIR